MHFHLHTVAALTHLMEIDTKYTKCNDQIRKHMQTALNVGLFIDFILESECWNAEPVKCHVLDIELLKKAPFKIIFHTLSIIRVFDGERHRINERRL